MSVQMRRVCSLVLLLVWGSARSGAAQDLPVLPPLEEEPLVEPPQVEPPPYPVQQFEQLPPAEPANPPLRIPASEPPPPPDEPLFSGGGIAVQGGIGASTQILLGFQAGGALFGLGLSLVYNQAGVASAQAVDQSGSTETIAFELATSFAYMAYNTKPLAFGPEIDFEAQLAPGTPFGHSSLVPGFAVWYAPFPAPLYIGTMIGLRIGFAAYANPTVATDYPGIRLRWGF